MRRKLIDLQGQREKLVANLEAAVKSNDQSAYDSALQQVENINDEIARVQKVIEEQDRKFTPMSPAEANDMAEERGNQLMKGQEIKLTNKEMRQRMLRNSVTLATGTLVEPTGAGSTIRDPVGVAVSSIIDQVYVQDLTGMGSFLEPYLISEFAATGGKVTTTAGTARTASSDPTFGVAKIAPYELTTTNFVDRNISRLSPASYYNKVMEIAMRALRRGAVDLIINGDGQSSPDFYGITTAKNTAGAAIYATETLSAVDETILDTLYFAYGSDDAIGQNARLYLPKTCLAELGKIRNNDKERVFKIRPDAGNPNSGMIEDGGVMTPYTILPKQTTNKLLYGDPMNFELGLFGEFSVRVDDSIKGVERMLTILGDAFVGGNLIRHHGFVVADWPTSGS